MGWFLIGMSFGGALGFMLFALLTVASQADDELDES